MQFFAIDRTCYLVLNRNGVIMDINKTGSMLLNSKRSSLVNRDFLEFVKLESRPVFNTFLKELFEKEVMTDCEIKLQFNNLTEIYVHIEAVINNDNKSNIKECYAVMVDITEQKKLEDALRESEQRLKFHFENSPLAIVEWDYNFVVTQWSLEAERIFGWKKEEVLGKLVDSLNIIYAEDIPIVNHTMERLVSGSEKKVISSHRNITRSGDIIECTWYNSVLLDKNGHISSVMSLVEDITDQKLAEREIKHLASFPQLNPNPVIELDLTGKLTFMNEAAKAVLEKYAPGSDFRIFLPYDLDKILKTLDQDKDSQTFYREIIIKDLIFGVTFHVSNMLKVVRFYLIDITERKKSEAELQKLNRTLKALYDSSHAMVYASNEKDYLREVCNLVLESCNYKMLWIGYAEEDENKSVRPVAYAGFEEGYLETLKISWADTERGRGPTGTAIRTGKASKCRNMLTDPAFKPWRKEAVKRGYSSSIAIPMITGGKTFGAITIYSKDPDPFSDDEERLLTELAHDLSYGIKAIRMQSINSKADEAHKKAGNVNAFFS